MTTESTKSDAKKSTWKDTAHKSFQNVMLVAIAGLASQAKYIPPEQPKEEKSVSQSIAKPDKTADEIHASHPVDVSSGISQSQTPPISIYFGFSALPVSAPQPDTKLQVNTYLSHKLIDTAPESKYNEMWNGLSEEIKNSDLLIGEVK